MGPGDLPPPLPLTPFLSFLSLPPSAELQPSEDYTCGAGEEEEEEEEEVSRPFSRCLPAAWWASAVLCSRTRSPIAPRQLCAEFLRGF